MPQDEQYEWPSFKTILRDVATSDGAVNVDHHEPSSTRITEGTDVLISKPDTRESDTSGLIDLLPEPLAPVEFDTSSVRSLLEPIGSSAHEHFDLDALEPLKPLSAPDADAPNVVPATSDSESSEDGSLEPESVFDLAFDPDADSVIPESSAENDSTANEPSIFDDVGGIEIPTETTTNAAVFEDLGIANEISLDDVPVFAEASEEPPAPSPFDDPEIPDVPSEAGFDSVATANAIEGELNELYELDNVIPLHPEVSEEPVANEPDANDSDWVNTVADSGLAGPPQSRVSHTGWVGLKPNESDDQAQEPDVDPWAYMRPSEETKVEGFWTKLFGGDERKRAKAQRLAKKKADANPAPAQTPSEVESGFDTSCPNCGSQCQVDLDDPIGRRVHVSCPDCDHMWNTPYYDAEAG